MHRSPSVPATLLTLAVLAAAACQAPEVAVTTTPPPEETTTLPAPPTTPPGEPEQPEEPEDPDPPRRRLAADLPGERTEVTGTVWEGMIIAVGGLDSQGRAMANVDIYHPDTDTWARGPDLPVALHHTAVATLGDRLYVVGGYAIEGGSWVPMSAVWSLGPGEDSWREEPPLATARGALAVASTGRRLVAVGGVGPDRRVLTSTEVLPAGGSWEPGPELAEPREHLAATAVGDDVYAIAGRAGGFDTNLASVEVLPGGADAWEQGPALNFSRGGIGAATVDGVPCVAGGEEPQGTIATIECLVSGAWEVVGELEMARHGLVVAALDGALHVIGGGPQPGLTVSGHHEVIPVG